MRKEVARRVVAAIALAAVSACSRELSAPRSADAVELGHARKSTMASNAVAVNGATWYGDGGELYPTPGIGAVIDTKETSITVSACGYDCPVSFTATHTGMWNDGCHFSRA